MFSIVQQSLFSAESSMRIAVHKTVSGGYEVAEIACEHLKPNLILISLVNFVDNNNKFFCNISSCHSRGHLQKS